MAAHILVTGGAGFIGSHLIRRLLGRGERITVLDDFNDFYDPARKRANIAPLLGRDDLRLRFVRKNGRVIAMERIYSDGYRGLDDRN